jgi:hypothetical protein
MREPITIIAGLILTLLIPRLVQLGIEALKSAAQQKLAWMIAQGAATKAQIMSVFAAWQIIGGWVLMAGAATINAVKIAASWLVAMGPVGWIIGLIALLVAGFVWAYNNVGWFKDGVDAAMRWVQEAFQNVVNWWNSDFMPALAAVGQWFSDMFTNVSNWFRDFIGFFVDGWGMAVDGARMAGDWLNSVFSSKSETGSAISSGSLLTAGACWLISGTACCSPSSAPWVTCSPPCSTGSSA